MERKAVVRCPCEACNYRWTLPNQRVGQGRARLVETHASLPAGGGGETGRRARPVTFRERSVATMPGEEHERTGPPRGRAPGGMGPRAGHKEILDRLARSKVCGAIRVADHCRSLPRGATKTSARGRSWRRWTFEFCQSGARRLATFSRQAGPPTSVLYFRHSNVRSNRRDIRPILRSKCSNTVARRTSGWLVQRANQARRAPYQLVSP